MNKRQGRTRWSENQPSVSPGPLSGPEILP